MVIVILIIIIIIIIIIINTSGMSPSIHVEIKNSALGQYQFAIIIPILTLVTWQIWCDLYRSCQTFDYAFRRYQNSLKIFVWCLSISNHQVASNICAYHNSTAVASYAKQNRTVFQNLDTGKAIFHRIWSRLPSQAQTQAAYLENWELSQ